MAQDFGPEAADPYRAPQSFPTDPGSVAPPPPYELYSVGAIVSATFFGSFLAAGLVAISQVLVIYLIAKGLLGERLRKHCRGHGQLASLWKALGIGLACWILEMAIIAVTVFVAIFVGPKIIWHLTQ